MNLKQNDENKIDTNYFLNAEHTYNGYKQPLKPESGYVKLVRHN
jgi:hypothetical protein